MNHCCWVKRVRQITRRFKGGLYPLIWNVTLDIEIPTISLPNKRKAWGLIGSYKLNYISEQVHERNLVHFIAIARACPVSNAPSIGLGLANFVGLGRCVVKRIAGICFASRRAFEECHFPTGFHNISPSLTATHQSSNQRSTRTHLSHHRSIFTRSVISCFLAHHVELRTQEI